MSDYKVADIGLHEFGRKEIRLVKMHLVVTCKIIK